MKAKIKALPIFKNKVEYWEPVFYVRGCLFKVERFGYLFHTEQDAVTWLKNVVRNGNNERTRMIP